MTYRSIRTIAIILTLGAAVLLGGCPPEKIKIGAVLPLTGEAGAYGEAVRKGMELAFDEIAESGEYDVQLSFVVVDTESSPEKAKEMLEEQYDSGALASIGGVTSGEAKEMISVVDRYDRILLSPSASSPDLTGISRNFYRIFPSDHTSANKMAQSAAQALGVTSIVIIAEEQPYAKDIQEVFRSAFESYEGQVLEVIEFPQGTTDLEALVSRAVSLEPDAVYLAGYVDGLAAMIQALHDLDFKGRILTTSAFATPSAIAKIGETAAGVFLTQTVFEVDSDHAHIKKFVSAFREKHGEDPDIYAAHGYDAMKVMAAALDGRPALPGEVKKGLRDTIKEFPGVTGSIQFDDKGDVRKFPRLYVIDKELFLVDYNDRVRKKQEEIREKREAIQRQLEELQKKAEGMGS
ncbi:MAG: penicillin-binding protein activator [Holophagales bacterium]|nr:penicillin-binding protein activator [Holophagales bacterium]